MGLKKTQEKQVKKAQMKVKEVNEPSLIKDMVPANKALEDETEELQTFEKEEANEHTNKTVTTEMVPAPEQTVSDPANILAAVKPEDDTTEEQNRDINDSKTAIIRGKPKLMKAAPPVVAVKMAHLQWDMSDVDESNKEDKAGPSLEDSEASKPLAVDRKLIKQLERKERKEKERIDKEMRQKEKKNKAEESKLKKEQEKLKRSHEKQLRNEQLKLKEEIKPLIENSTVKVVVENVPVSNTDEEKRRTASNRG